LLGGALIYFIWNYFKIKRKSLQIIDRSEVERIKFIDRMWANKVNSKLYLYRGDSLLGLITHKREFISKEERKKRNKANDDKLESELKEYHVSQVLVKPCIIFKIANPFAKIQPFQFNDEMLKKTSVNWYLPRWISIDKDWGINYDETIIDIHRRIIKNDNVIRTDLNELASVYYVKAQEQCTFDPINAHAMALKEKELEIELAKKKGMQESI
jgi:hypothetical protein